ncbi:dihydrodipicolinate synthase family protein [Schaedlerella arabinosiphila]|uniref:Dihydrodipicolinate synthase family protein n=2 Tax=Schaedlerella arabinosiphila TaxID=2044587 RepID=A0A3R8JVN4_9FIRM|nr:dihydrodipicolinate synthase family protein [Schaedlerella arabinosiphila]
MRGIVVPILTPIDEEEKIDEAKLREQVDFVIEGGVLGILAFGSNGEFYMVEEEEMLRALEIMLDQSKGRVPVFMGIGAVNTRIAARIAKAAEKAGAFGISVLQPMFLKPTETELYQHFKEIAQTVPDMPMLLYNNPGRTGYTMSADLVERLAGEIENIVGIKDSSGDMTQTEEFIRRTRKMDFKVFGGKDTLIYGALAHGAAGCVATTANFVPEMVVSIYDHYVSGDAESAREAQYALNPIRLLMDKASFPVATKDFANLAGREVGVPYRPNLPTSGHTLELMKKAMEEAGVI